MPEAEDRLPQPAMADDAAAARVDKRPAARDAVIRSEETGAHDQSVVPSLCDYDKKRSHKRNGWKGESHVNPFLLSQQRLSERERH